MWLFNERRTSPLGWPAESRGVTHPGKQRGKLETRPHALPFSVLEEILNNSSGH